jgi:hypothetical protein
MQHYIRLAGIEIQGITERLKVFPGDLQKSEAREGLAEASPSFFPTKSVSNS